MTRLIPLLLLLTACGQGEAIEGRPVAPTTAQPGGTLQPSARSYALTGFTAVESSGPDRVEVRVGPDFSVRAEGPPAVLATLVVAREGEALMIARERGSDRVRGTATLFVTLPRIVAVSLRGSGTVTVDQVRGPSLDATVAGSGDLTIGRAAVEVATLNLGGSGELRVGGTAGRLTLSSAGSGDVDLSGLTAGQATVTVQGSGDVTGRVTGPASVSVMGSGDVRLLGGADCRISVMGSGKVRCLPDDGASTER